MTKKMPTLFAKMPPRRPLTSLDAIVDDWTYRFGADGPERHRRDTVVEFCAMSKDFTQAVTRACASRTIDGKMHNHQSRVKETDRDFFRYRILKSDADDATDFDALHDVLESIAPPGIGPVTVYDVATRVGAFLKLEPKSLYLHAGVRVGLAALLGHRTPAIDRVPLTDLPKPLQRLPPDEIEDMLCAYREFFKPGMVK